MIHNTYKTDLWDGDCFHASVVKHCFMHISSGIPLFYKHTGCSSSCYKESGGGSSSVAFLYAKYAITTKQCCSTYQPTDDGRAPAVQQGVQFAGRPSLKTLQTVALLSSDEYLKHTVHCAGGNIRMHMHCWFPGLFAHAARAGVLRDIYIYISNTTHCKHSEDNINRVRNFIVAGIGIGAQLI